MLAIGRCQECSRVPGNQLWDSTRKWRLRMLIVAAVQRTLKLPLQNTTIGCCCKWNTTHVCCCCCLWNTPLSRCCETVHTMAAASANMVAVSVLVWVSIHQATELGTKCCLKMWGPAFTSRSCAALGRVSEFLSSALFRKSLNSGDLLGKKRSSVFFHLQNYLEIMHVLTKTYIL